VTHPGIHGYEQWHATEASAASSSPNCGCFPDDGKRQCITGGGKVNDSAFQCTNYWRPTDAAAPRVECRSASSSDRSCVTNLTTPIHGDDSKFIVDRMEDFLDSRKGAAAPFLATLWLHTVHSPHPATPEYFAKYANSDDGDYLGTVSQMDHQIGRLRKMLKLFNNTMLFFTSDNVRTRSVRSRVWHREWGARVLWRQD
jgi:arylsulfatase A-like enzyme